MGKRINRLGKGTCYHGNAGIASAFAALVNRKLKPGGVLAMVLPLSAAAGLSWQGFRELLGREYTDLTVLSIAANGKDMSFSSDTGMAECLVIARKSCVGAVREPPPPRAHFTSLARRPDGFASAALLARGLIDYDEIRNIEDGPYGGSALMEGDTAAGEVLSAPSRPDGDVWGAVRVSDYSVAQTADALTNSKLWLPGTSKALDLPILALGEIGSLGLVDRDINRPRCHEAHSTRPRPAPQPRTPLCGTTKPRTKHGSSASPTHSYVYDRGWKRKLSVSLGYRKSRSRQYREFRFRLPSHWRSRSPSDRVCGRNAHGQMCTFDDSPVHDYAFAVMGERYSGIGVPLVAVEAVKSV